MKIELNGNKIIVYREPGDPGKLCPGGWNAEPEGTILYHVVKKLNALGCDLIKKRIQKDGYLFGYETMQYVRTRGPKSSGPHIYILNADYCVYDSVNDWNKNGRAEFLVEFDVFETGQDSKLLEDILSND